MNEMTKNILTGVAVSVAVSSFAISMSFGTLTENVESINDDITMLKRVRTEHIKELNLLALEDKRINAEVEELKEDEEDLRHAVRCILSINPNSETALADQLQCISHRDNKRSNVPEEPEQPDGPYYFVRFKD